LKILVVYDSRHGFTERCLDLLSGELPPVIDLWPLKRRPGTPDWSTYDAVVFGGPVYFGHWSPRLVRFLGRHPALAAHPCVAAFVVSLSPKAAALSYLRRALPEPLAGKPGHVACFGGGITWKALSWWEKFLLKHSQDIETDISNLDLGEIQALATWLSAHPGSANSGQA
jgi:menaquinone-dependent protoporphyrinogen IX oxidase